jgi:hypothetical protein
LGSRHDINKKLYNKFKGVVMKKMLLMAVYIGVILVCCGTISNVNKPEKEKYTWRYYEGSGGKGIRAAVLRPEGKELNQNEQWLLDMIHGSITSDFSKYTAMTVIDRQNLDKILTNQEESATGIYSDGDYVSIGNITNAQYVVIGKLARIPGNTYLFELGISDSSKGERIASYPPQTCSYEQLANMSIIKSATEDLLNQLGIVLTDSGKSALANVNSATMNSETALSKGFAAQRKGTVVEAMSYYYNAISYNPSLKEATSRINKLSSDISSGNIGENVRNDIERRKKWITVIEECNTFFKEHMPYEIVYDPELTQGNIDYRNETVDISVPMIVQPNKDDFKIIQNVLTGLDKTGKRLEWGLEDWPLTSDAFVNAMIASTASSFGRDPVANIAEGYGIEKSEYTGGNRDYGKSIEIKISLINGDGKAISEATKAFFQSIKFNAGNGAGRGNKGSKLELNYNEPVGGRSYNYAIDALNQPTVFKGVSANDITDNLIIKIISVNDIDIYDRYVKIPTGKIKQNLGRSNVWRKIYDSLGF